MDDAITTGFSPGVRQLSQLLAQGRELPIPAEMDLYRKTSDSEQV